MIADVIIGVYVMALIIFGMIESDYEFAWGEIAYVIGLLAISPVCLIADTISIAMH